MIIIYIFIIANVRSVQIVCFLALMHIEEIFSVLWRASFLQI
jgi:uncharacterized integral membrane protein